VPAVAWSFPAHVVLPFLSLEATGRRPDGVRPPSRA
jgi:hypothetical protein